MGEKNVLINLLKADQVDEIIGPPPLWLIRGGTIIFLIVLMLIMLMVYIIRYPEYIIVPFKTKSENGRLCVILEVPVSDLYRLTTGQHVYLKFDVDKLPLFDSTTLTLQEKNGQIVESVADVPVYLSNAKLHQLNIQRTISVGMNGTAKILVSNKRASERIFKIDLHNINVQKK